jgi:hypothetical protein
MRYLLATFVAFFLSAGLAHAGEAPAAGIVLSVEIKSGDQRKVELTMDNLMKLPTSIITTRTPWHDGEQIFEGVRLSDLMAALHAKGETLHVTALNRYETEIPFSDITEHAPVLAYRLNGKPMRIEDKGPLFIIYGFDDSSELNSELYFGRSAWQVRTMTVQ